MSLGLASSLSELIEIFLPKNLFAMFAWEVTLLCPKVSQLNASKFETNRRGIFQKLFFFNMAYIMHNDVKKIEFEYK